MSGKPARSRWAAIRISFIHSPKKPVRASVECNLQFCGLIVMKNPLRPESAPVIEILNEANIRTVMVTGEHIRVGLGDR